MSETGSGSAATHGLSLWGLISLSAAPAVAYGLSRFAYALILPPMKTDLGLTFTQAGSINTANNLGYLIGALLAMALVRQANAKAMFFFGIFATGVALCATALWRDLNALLAVRVISGIPAAIALVAGGILATHAGGGTKFRSSLALNIYYCGGGLGIVLSTAAALPILPVDGYAAWPLTWFLLGCITIVSAVPALFAVRRIVMRPAKENAPASIRRLTGLGSVAAAYFCFGIGYIGYMTFVIAYLRGSEINSYGIALFWIVVGVASSLGGFVWTPIFSRLSGAGAMAAVMATIGTGTLLPIISPTLPVTMLSAVLFGSSFLSVVASVNYAIRGQLPAEQWGPAIGTMTVVVSVAQSIGPIAAGWLSEAAGRLSTGLTISPIFLLLGASLVALRAFSQRNTVQAKQAWS